MKHVDSGWRCLVAHPDQEGQCVKCSGCGLFVKPKDMDQECPGPRGRPVGSGKGKRRKG